MDCLQTVRRQTLRRKVTKIEGDDSIRSCANCGSHDMAIARIRQTDGGYEVVVSCDECIASILIHQFSRALQLCVRNIRAVLTHAGNPLVVNLVGPASQIDVLQRQPHQQIAKWRRIQDTSVINYRILYHAISTPSQVSAPVRRAFPAFRHARRQCPVCTLSGQRTERGDAFPPCETEFRRLPAA